MRKPLYRPIAAALFGLVLSVAGLAEVHAGPRTVVEFRAGEPEGIKVDDGSRKEAAPLISARSMLKAAPLIRPFVNAVHRFVLDEAGDPLTWEIQSASGERIVLFEAPEHRSGNRISLFVDGATTTSGPIVGVIVSDFIHNPSRADAGLSPFLVNMGVHSGDVSVVFSQQAFRTFPAVTIGLPPF